MPAKLAVGFAHLDDYDGAYFTVQALRLYSRDVLKDIEFVVVDNKPSSRHGQMVRTLVEGWARAGCNGAKYVPLENPVGTSPSRDAIFQHATAPAVLVVDCHVLLAPGALKRLVSYWDANPTSRDIVTGPLVYDDLANITTHFNDTWRGEMWGTWGNAWACSCGQGIKFSPQEGKELGLPEPVVFRDLGMGVTPLKRCFHCGKALPDGVQWPGHQKALFEAGYVPLGFDDDSPAFEIPGQGLGLFSMRRDAWPGFNPHARGFGGEELYIHEKVRMQGGAALCLPFLKWVHRFGRANGVPYPLGRHAKVRNYVLEFKELGRDLAPVYDHFVASGLYPKESWAVLVADPVGTVEDPGQAKGCGTCGGATKDERIAQAANLGQVYAVVEATPRDLDRHMPKLRELSGKCEYVTEISKRNESLVALAAGQPKVLRSYNTEFGERGAKVQALAKEAGMDFRYTAADSEGVASIEPTDMLFIDSTAHTFARLSGELAKYAGQVRRFIVVHDTKLHAEKGEDGGPGLLAALRAFMKANPQWSVVYHTDEQYGLTVLGCQSQDKPKLPKLMTMAANFSKAVAEHVATGAGQAPTDVLEARLEKCSLCPMRRDEQCSVCGCFIAKKAAWAEQVCPLGHWDRPQDATDATGGPAADQVAADAAASDDGNDTDYGRDADEDRTYPVDGREE